MSYELKKVKIYDELSEETMCFKAEIWEDGKLVADVSNTGKGGCNDIYVHSKENRGLYMKYMNLEFEIMERADEFHRIQRLQSKGLVLKKDDKLFTMKFPMGITKFKKSSNYENWRISNVNSLKSQGYQIMNTNL